MSEWSDRFNPADRRTPKGRVVRPQPELNPAYAMLKIVDELSAPHTVIVDDLDGKFLGHRQENPLLLKLRNAVGSNIGGNGGDGKPARERVPIDVSAADLYTDITENIREWYGRETDYAEHGRPLPEVTLRQWYLRFVNRWRAGEITEDTMWSQIRILESWVRQVRDKLDPPNRIEITAPCPMCGTEWVNIAPKIDGAQDPKDAEMVRVLNAVEAARIDDAYALCRACGTVWKGVSRMRALRIAIDDAETLKLSLEDAS
jgi:hypothetical protein